MTTQEILKECTVQDHVIKLPPRQLSRDDYGGVKKALEKIGGKWTGGKVAGFVFQANPKSLLSQIVGGAKIDLKRDFQFFGTPRVLADRLVSMANIDKSHAVLEPSAGQGAVVEAINRRFPGMTVDCFELMETNRYVLTQIPTVVLIGNDFLACQGKWHRIVANPPFTKNQDIDHIKKMYECLTNGGVLVSVASVHWKHSKNKKETAFRQWLSAVNATEMPVESGSFKESGTDVEACIIYIQKPS